MADTFLQSQTAATTYLNQAQNQLATAVRLDGELASAVATRQVTRAENLYGQVNTFLGLATTSNNTAYVKINDMARSASNPIENQETLAATAIYRSIQDGINSVRTSSSSLLNQLNDIRYNETYNVPTPAANSSGEEVIQAQTANADDALVQNPPEPIQTFDEQGNLVDVPAGYSEDTNANDPILLNNADLGDVDGTSVVGGNRDIITTNQTQGGNESAPGEDARDQSPSVVGSGVAEGGAVAVAPDFLQPIKTQPNVLNKLASMTYTASIYLMNLDEYKALLVSEKKRLPTQQLLIQSGGIDQGLGFGSGQRNKNFDVDFYIDDIEILGTVGTQGGTRSSNGLILKFNIIEPNGITFLNRLRNAVRQHMNPSDPTMSELNATFLMVIRFYGYDSNGTLINGSKLGVTEVGSDNNAVVEKWFPFQFTNITYRIANKLTEYKCESTIPQVNVGFSWRSTIPFDFQLTAPDVKTLLNGKTLFTTNRDPTNLATDEIGEPIPAPNSSDLSIKNTYTNGLAEALNQWQQDQVKIGKQEYADRYTIQIENAAGLADAKVAKQGPQEKSRTAQAPARNAREKIDPRTNNYNKDSKNWSITRGTPIVQVIELVLRNSTYITNQQNVQYNEKDQAYVPHNTSAYFQWFRIRCFVKPTNYDRKRRDYAYDIVYTITRYLVNDPRIKEFPKTPYRGVHKVYNYWFTGENTEVLDLDIQVDYNYLTPFFSGKPNNLSPDVDPYTRQNPRLYERRLFANKPNAEGTGGLSDSTTAAAAVSERYYTFADIQKSNLTILGDPDLLQQSEVIYNFYKEVGSSTSGVRATSTWMPDGSANFDAGEVLYEIRFNPVTDYNLSDGLAHVNANNLAYSQTTGERNLPSEASVFAIAYINNYFKQGKFTQKITGMVRFFDPTLVTPGAATLAQGSGNANLDKVTQNNSNTQNIPSNATNTGTLPVPTYNDPYGTGDPAATVNSASNPAPKEGSNTVSDDALETTTPFIGA